MKQAINDKNKYPKETFIFSELAALLKISDIFKYNFSAGI
jgi:hypothetical protein